MIFKSKFLTHASLLVSIGCSRGKLGCFTEMRWDEMRWDEIRSDQMRSDEIRSDQMRSDEMRYHIWCKRIRATFYITPVALYKLYSLLSWTLMSAINKRRSSVFSLLCWQHLATSTVVRSNAQNFWWSLALRFLSYASGQTNRRTHHNTSHASWGEVIKCTASLS